MSTKAGSTLDGYIAKAAPFSQPIFTHLRELIHAACPEVEETLKWGHASFLLQGRILCMFSAFESHCRFGFWHPEMSVLVRRELGRSDEEEGGQFGRIASLEDLPGDDVMRRYLAEAVRLGQDGKRARSKTARPAPHPELEVPEALAARLRQHPAAREAFEGFGPGQRGEYIEWITEAKREATRAKRLDTAIEWLTAGKPRHWKHQNG